MAKLRIADLEPTLFRRGLQNPGICIQTGPFLVRIQSSVPALSEHLYRLYGDFDLDLETKFSDFHIRIEPYGWIRRWLRPQIRFIIDDSSPFNTLPARLALPLFEWGLNWAIARYANQFLILHSAVLEKEGCALLLPSPPGSGKSTLCAALAIEGWRLFSDELALIQPSHGDLVPLPRPISLKNESIELIAKLSSKVNFGPTFRDTQKGTVVHMPPSHDSVARSNEPAPVAWIVYPSYRSGESTILRRISRTNSLLRAAGNSFNYSLLGEKGFETLASIIDRSDSYELIFGDLNAAIEKLRNELPKQEPAGVRR